MFFQKSACPQSLSPLGHSVGFASCKAWCVLISASLPKTLFPSERLCMLGWLCIVQSLWVYTPGIRAGAECGAAALTPLGATPKARMLWLLAKSFARCKTSRASNAKHPISKIIQVFRQSVFCLLIFYFAYSPCRFLFYVLK